MNKQQILQLIDSSSQPRYVNEIFGTSNRKLMKNGIISFDLPALLSCPFASECKKFCYANKGTYRYPTVQKKYLKNFELAKTKNFVNVANDSLKALPNTKFVRLHSSGDFFSRSYVKSWIEIMIANPSIVFYAYTKSMQLFKKLDLPSNFIMIQSDGTLDDDRFIDQTKPFAKIFDSIEDLMDAVDHQNFIDASHDDLNAIKGALLGMNIALIKH